MQVHILIDNFNKHDMTMVLELKFLIVMIVNNCKNMHAHGTVIMMHCLSGDVSFHTYRDW